MAWLPIVCISIHDRVMGEIDNSDLINLVAVGAALVMLFTTFIIYFVTKFRSDKINHLRERDKMKATYDSTILQVQMEISEQTLQKISQEIHDNVGQRLTLAIMYLQGLPIPGEDSSKHTIGILEQALDDLRHLSRSLNGSYILNNGLELTIEHEVEVINKSHKMRCRYECHGERHNLGEKEEVVLFRCVQEALNNALKHSGGSRLEIRMNQTENGVTIFVEDFGHTTNLAAVTGVGLISMKQRIDLLKGRFEMHAKETGGIIVEMHVPTLT
jgi:two-component system, NarL family, sensor kinase